MSFCASTFLFLVTLQSLTASGVVTDQSGDVLPGADVVLEHVTSGVRRVIHTDQAGSFRFDDLQRGSYSVTVAKPGFFAAAYDLELESGKLIEFVLVPVTILDQQVEVVARPMPIDTEVLSVRQDIGERQVQQLPYTGRRNFLNAVTYSPGIMRDNFGILRFHGSERGQVRYLLDGVNLTDPSTASLTSSVPIDAVENVEVDLVGFSAEYGKASGGVVRVNSQLIGNEFRWDLTDFVPGVNFKRRAVGEFSPRLQLSGPLVEGRLWGMYSASTRYVQTYNDELPPEADSRNETRVDQLARVQWKLIDGHSVSLNLLHGSLFLGNLGLDVRRPLETTTNFLDRNTTVAVSNRKASGRALLEGRFQWTRQRETQLAKGTQPLEIRPAGWTGNFFGDTEDRNERFSFRQTLAWEISGTNVTHRFKLGGEFDYVRAEESARRRGFFVFDAEDRLDTRVDFTGPSSAEIRNREYGLFFRDRMAFSRFQVEAGLRLDRESVVGATNLAPRVGVSVLPFGDERAKVTAGLGLFYDNFVFRRLLLARLQRRSTTSITDDGPVTLQPAGLGVAEELHNPYGVHWNLGWAQEWAPRWVTRFNYVEKRGRRQVRVAAGPVGDGFGLEVNNSGRSIYRALEMTIDRPIRSDLRFLASYTYSRSERRPSVSFDFPDPTLESVAMAPANWDTPHRFVSWGYFPMLFQTQGAFTLEARSGFPFTITDALQRKLGIYNAERLPAFFVINFNVEREIPFLGGRRLGVRIGVTNLLDRFNPRFVDSVQTSPTFMKFSDSSGRGFVGRLRVLKR